MAGKGVVVTGFQHGVVSMPPLRGAVQTEVVTLSVLTADGLGSYCMFSMAVAKTASGEEGG
jgi:hypothetical protein